MGIESEVKILHDDELKSISDGYCPDCGWRGFVLGPRAGLSRNIECGRLECRARFNILDDVRYAGVFYGHRIERQIEGGSDNWGTPR